MLQCVEVFYDSGQTDLLATRREYFTQELGLPVLHSRLLPSSALLVDSTTIECEGLVIELYVARRGFCVHKDLLLQKYSSRSVDALQTLVISRDSDLLEQQLAQNGGRMSFQLDDETVELILNETLFRSASQLPSS